MDRQGEGLLLGIEIGGTKLQLGLGRGDGDLVSLERRKIEPAQGAAAILEQIRDGHRALLKRQSLRPDDVLAVGVGFGGPVDADRGRVKESYQVEGWTDFPLAEWLTQHLDIPAVQIQNDADTAGLAEGRLGAGVGYAPLLYLTIGSGIGGALILSGKIYRGCGLGALEIGHTEVPDPSRPGFACRELEQVASGWGISRQACEFARAQVLAGNEGWTVLDRAGGDPEAITAESVARAAMDGDGPASEILHRAHEAMAYALRHAIALLGPRRIILGGGVSLIGESGWFEPIRRLVEATVFAPFRDSYDIVPAALGEQVVVHGALALAQDAASAPGSPATRSWADLA
jgi:glucokinase